MHSRDRLKQRVKQIRKRKEKNAKNKAINYLNKKKAAKLLKDHINKQKVNPPVNPTTETKTPEPYLIINKNTLTKKAYIYWRKAKKNALKIITRARKSRAKLKRKAGEKLADIFDNSDSETIPYAEPYKNTFTNKVEIYRRNAKKKALKILRNKRRRVDPPSDAETIPYTVPCKNTFSKRDNLYRRKAKKQSLRIITQAKESRAKAKHKNAEELAKLERQVL